MDYNATKDALFRPELTQTTFPPHSSPGEIPLCIEACRLAYYKTEFGDAELDRLKAALANIGFGEVTPLRSSAFVDAQGFGAFRAADGTALVAFRGTEPDKLADLGSDADIRPVPGKAPVTGLVHHGFHAAFWSLNEQIDTWLGTLGGRRARLFMCGHSLGAAMAMVGAHVYRPQLLVTIGCPRTGDADFVGGLAGIRLVRIVDCADLVPELPPPLFGYTHPPSFTYIDRNGKTSANPPADFVTDDQMRGRLEYVRDYAWRHGTVPIRDLADHAPLNYLRAFPNT
jgi:hypothetical protein